MKPFFSKPASYFLFSGFFSLMLLSNSAQAASLNLVSSRQSFDINEIFTVDLMLDARGEEINAIRDSIIFPEDLLALKEISDGGSIVPVWVEKPRYSEAIIRGAKFGRVDFSGIIPGGFSGVLEPNVLGRKSGKILSLSFSAKKSGSDLMRLEEALLLLNDGRGTKTGATLTNFLFKISEKVSAQASAEIDHSSDTNPPEPFVPRVAQDKNIFDGRWFVSWNTQDKESGLDHYEIFEASSDREPEGAGEAAVSPYLLKDQTLRSYIFVKALDKAGNTRMAEAPPQSSKRQSLINYFMAFVIILGGVFIYWGLKFRWQSRTKTVSC